MTRIIINIFNTSVNPLNAPNMKTICRPKISKNRCIKKIEDDKKKYADEYNLPSVLYMIHKE